MKKVLKKFLTVLIALTIAISTLSGCKLITTNVDRDMNQIVAKVSIDDDITEYIYKREMVSEFNSYGYYYTMYYGYTTQQAYEYIIENLAKNKIIVQQSVKALMGKTDEPGNETGYFAQANAVSESDRTVEENILATVKNYNGEKFVDVTLTPKQIIEEDKYQEILSEFEYYKGVYNVLRSTYTLADSFIEKDEEEESNSYEIPNYTPRQTLTESTETDGNEWEIRYDEEKKVASEKYLEDVRKLNKKYELGIDEYIVQNTTKTKYEISLALYKAYENKFNYWLENDREFRNALTKGIKQLKKVGLVKENESANPKSTEDLFNLTYFKDILSDEFQASVVGKYKYALENQQKKNFNIDVLYDEYLTLYNSQKTEADSNLTSFENQLSQVADNSFVVYNSTDGYGYVSNLLIGFNAKQSELLSNYTNDGKLTQSDKNAYRAKLLEGLTVRDLRESWVLSGYGDYDAENGTFTFDEKYCKTEALRQFNGTMYGATKYTYKEDEEDVEAYHFKEVVPTKVPFETFYQNVLTNVMGFDAGIPYYEKDNQATIKTISTDNTITKLDDAILEKFTDIIYAYSTDGGSLQENYGYVYSPITSKDQYVEEFASSAGALIAKGAGAYTITATDYGYHIMLCTYVLDTKTLISKDTFETDLNDKDSFASQFKKAKIDLVVNSEVEIISSSFISKYEKDKIVYYKDAYADLVEVDE